jgi:hypothetical protein
LSVNNDVVVRTRHSVASIEQRILLERLAEMGEKRSEHAKKLTNKPDSEWKLEC